MGSDERDAWRRGGPRPDMCPSCLLCAQVDKFGKVRRAMHGTQRLDFRQTHDVYGEDIVDLKNTRYVFLNTLFSVSEGCLYLQLVDRYDEGAPIPSNMHSPLSPLTIAEGGSRVCPRPRNRFDARNILSKRSRNYYNYSPNTLKIFGRPSAGDLSALLCVCL